VKPFNFLLSAQVAPLGHPVGVDPTRFRLVAPFAKDGVSALSGRWIDQYTGTEHAVTASHGSPAAARLMSMRDMLARYATHPEPRSADVRSGVCSRAAAGLLVRRPVNALIVSQVGKEGRGAQVELPSVDAIVPTHFLRANSTLDNLRTALRAYTAAEIAKRTGLSNRAVKATRNRHSSPSAATLRALVGSTVTAPT
jgi:hypothetical protein